MDSNKIYTEVVRVHPDELVMFSRIEYIKDTRHFNKKSLSNLKLNYSRTKLSENSERKAKRAIKYMLFGTNEKKAWNPKYNSTYTFKVNFITLTLPSIQKHSDIEIKKGLLNQFLIECKIKYKLTNYVWKMEKQRNGNVHFHILGDQFIPYSELNNIWNRLCLKMGYSKEYKVSNKTKIANSTDIHSLRKIKNVVGYVLKYMVKEDKKNRLKIHRSNIEFKPSPDYNKNSLSINTKRFLNNTAQRGRIWTCSYNLTKLKGGEEELDNMLKSEIELLKKKKGTRVYNKDFCTALYMDSNILSPELTPNLYRILMDYIRKLFPNYQTQIILNSN